MTRVRFKSSRPVYRRGGLILSSAAWVEVDPMSLDKAANLALLEDPVVLVEVGVGGEAGVEWLKFTDADRQMAVSLLRDGLFDQPHSPSQPAGEEVAGPGQGGGDPAILAAEADEATRVAQAGEAARQEAEAADAAAREKARVEAEAEATRVAAKAERDAAKAREKAARDAAKAEHAAAKSAGKKPATNAGK